MAARAWERLGPPERVTWFPPAPGPVVLASPGPGTELRPMTPLRLTFSVPVAQALGSARPTLSPRVPGQWEEADDHTLVFQPSQFGAPFDGEVHVGLTRALAVAAIGKPAQKATRSIRWPVAPAAFLRLQQLLAEQGYLPVRWQSTAPDVGRTATAPDDRRGRSARRVASAGATRTPRPSSSSSGRSASRTRSRAAR